MNEAMDTAADKAIKEFTQEIVAQMSPEERRGAQKVLDWVRDNRGQAGYRRLLRFACALKVDA